MQRNGLSIVDITRYNCFFLRSLYYNEGIVFIVRQRENETEIGIWECVLAFPSLGCRV